MTSIGETLRRERLQKGLELQQLSESTKIGTRMLQAMEQNDFGKLPGGVFTRSFIKQYAAALGLDPALLEEQLSLLQTDQEEPSRYGARKDVIPEHSHYSLSDYNSARNSGSLLMSLLWVGVAILVGGAVYYMMNRPQSAPVEATKQATPTTLGNGEPEKPAVAAPVNPDVSNQPSAVQVDLKAAETAWISVAADGKTQFVGDMRQGETRTVQGHEKVRLVAGNAGALEVLLNGKAVEAIGPKGQVRVVEFTATGAHVVPRTPPKPAPLP